MEFKGIHIVDLHEIGLGDVFVGSGANFLMLVECMVPRDDHLFAWLFGSEPALPCSSPLD